MILRIIIGLTLIILFSNIGISQPDNNDLPPNREPGKCYAKALIEHKYEVQIVELPMYVGDQNNDVKFEEVILQRDNQFFDTIQIVDTTTTKEYVLESFEHNVLIDENVWEWMEVLCGNKVTRRTIKEIQKRLIEQGYDELEFNGTNVLGTNTKRSFRKFQKANGLPIGQLDFETLDRLGVNY